MRVTYGLDSLDRITEVGGDWLEFACRNDAPELTPEAAVGQTLDRYIDHHEVRDLYKVLFRKTRQSGEPLTLPFRCDSPACRRFMELSVTPLPGGALSLVAVLLREEDRTEQSLWSRFVPRGDQLLTVCSWCKAVRDADGHWLEVEAAASGGLLALSRPPRLTHGICPACRVHLLGDIGPRPSP